LLANDSSDDGFEGYVFKEEIVIKLKERDKRNLIKC
jgi:hypothetical protein